jgi:hypothetical protein
LEGRHGSQPRCCTPVISFVWFFVPLRQVVGNVVPWSFRSNKHVTFWLHSGVVIERPQWEAQRLWIAIDYSDQVGATNGTKRFTQSWRGLIARKQVFAGEPFEILGLHCRSCSERGTMRLPAHGAMAIERPSQRSIDAIANLTAQATAFESHSSVPFRDIRCHVVPSGTMIINGKLLFADTRPSTAIRDTDRIADGGASWARSAARSGRRPRRRHGHGRHDL